MVECDLAKVEVAGSNPVSRSKIFKGQINDLVLFYCRAPLLHKTVTRILCLAELETRASVYSTWLMVSR